MSLLEATKMLQEVAIEKLNRLATDQDISKSKVINRWFVLL